MKNKEPKNPLYYYVKVPKPNVLNTSEKAIRLSIWGVDLFWFPLGFYKQDGDNHYINTEFLYNKLQEIKRLDSKLGKPYKEYIQSRHEDIDKIYTFISDEYIKLRDDIMKNVKKRQDEYEANTEKREKRKAAEERRKIKKAAEEKEAIRMKRILDAENAKRIDELLGM